MNLVVLFCLLLCFIIAVYLIIVFITSYITYVDDLNVKLSSGAFGQECSSSTDCGTGLSCDYLTFTCKRSTGNPCTFSSDCTYINNCSSKGLCQLVNPTGGTGGTGSTGNTGSYVFSPCLSGDSCLGGSLTGNTDMSSCICLYIDGASCTSNEQCDSFNCTGGICQSGTPNGYPCSTNSDCQSNNCSNKFCQASGIVSGTTGAACLTSTCGAPDLNLNSNCESGLACLCSGNGPGQCTTPLGFGQECSLTNDHCSPYLQCSQGIIGAGTTTDRCLFNPSNTISVRPGGECVSIFTPDIITGPPAGVLCKGNSGAMCYGNGDCNSNSCKTLSYPVLYSYETAFTSIFNSYSIDIAKYPVPLEIDDGVLLSLCDYGWATGISYNSNDLYGAVEVWGANFKEDTSHNFTYEFSTLGLIQSVSNVVFDQYNFYMLISINSTQLFTCMFVWNFGMDTHNFSQQYPNSNQFITSDGNNLTGLARDGTIFYVYDKTGIDYVQITSISATDPTGGYMPFAQFGNKASINSPNFNGERVNTANGYMAYSIPNGVALWSFSTQQVIRNFTFNSVVANMTIGDFKLFISNNVICIYFVYGSTTGLCNPSIALLYNSTTSSVYDVEQYTFLLQGHVPYNTILAGGDRPYFMNYNQCS